MVAYERFLWARSEIETHHFCPHSLGQNSIVWPHLTAKEAEGCCLVSLQKNKEVSVIKRKIFIPSSTGFHLRLKTHKKLLFSKLYITSCMITAMYKIINPFTLPKIFS